VAAVDRAGQVAGVLQDASGPLAPRRPVGLGDGGQGRPGRAVRGALALEGVLDAGLQRPGDLPHGRRQVPAQGGQTAQGVPDVPVLDADLDPHAPPPVL